MFESWLLVKVTLENGTFFEKVSKTLPDAMERIEIELKDMKGE